MASATNSDEIRVCSTDPAWRPSPAAAASPSSRASCSRKWVRRKPSPSWPRSRPSTPLARLSPPAVRRSARVSLGPNTFSCHRNVVSAMICASSSSSARSGASSSSSDAESSSSLRAARGRRRADGDFSAFFSLRTPCVPRLRSVTWSRKFSIGSTTRYDVVGSQLDARSDMGQITPARQREQQPDVGSAQINAGEQPQEQQPANVGLASVRLAWAVPLRCTPPPPHHRLFLALDVEGMGHQD